MGGRINTIMQACFFAISGVLPRAGGHRAHQGGDRRRPTASRGPRSCAGTSRPSTPRSPTCTGSSCRPSPRRTASPPMVSAAAPDFVQRVTAVMMAGKGDLLPVSAFPVDGTWPVGTTQWEKRNIAAEIPVWDPKSASSATSACWSARTPPSAPRSTTRRPLAGAPATFKSDELQGRTTVEGQLYTLQVAPGGLHGLRALRGGLPGEGQAATRGTRPSTWRRSRRCARPSARTTSSSWTCPSPRPHGEQRLDVKDSQFLPAALRVLRRLRRLRRDALRQAAHPALRRPRPDRQRHRLLLDLRRQPADHALHDRTPSGRGPAWSNSLFEDNAEFGLGFRLAARRPPGPGARRCCARWPRRSATDLVTALLDGRPVGRGRHRGPARARGARCSSVLARASDAQAPPARAVADDLVRQERLDRGRRRLGLRHRLRRPRPRAGQRPQRQRPGARHRGLLQHRRPAVARPRRSARPPSSRRPARRRRRRTWACWP